MQSDDEQPPKADEPAPQPVESAPCEPPERDDDLPEWLVAEPEPQLRAHQFGLLGLFGFTAACGLYVFLETRHRGQFGLHALAGAALFAGVALPAFWLIMALVRAVFDRDASFARMLLGVVLIMVSLYGVMRYLAF